MSGYKTILVPVADAASGAEPLGLGLSLATAFGAHVTALHVRSDPALAVPLVGEGMTGAMVEEMVAEAERQTRSRADAAHAAFTAAIAEAGVALSSIPGAAAPSAEWVDVTGREEEAVAWRGRLADLVVIGRPLEGAETPSLMTLNAALMESGRPLLLAPPARSRLPAPVVTIAWNGSAAAGRAVGAALPLLKRAEVVHILSINEDERTASAPAAELSAYLAWHGIQSDARLLGAGSRHAGEMLLAESEALGAGLLVMGAYTHSRLRQLILGGVTRHVLHQASIPVLMYH